MKHIPALLAVMLAVATQAQVTHELLVEDDQFNPSSMTIAAGDHVHIHWDNSVTHDHTFTQVTQATWNANGTTVLPGGYNFGVGTPNPGIDFTITPLSAVWYVCQNHVSMGMKGTINVTGTSGIEEPMAQESITLAPNPASASVSIIAPGGVALMVSFYDAVGRNFMSTELNGDRTIDTHGFCAGIYFAEIRNLQGILLSRQRLVITR